MHLLNVQPSKKQSSTTMRWLLKTRFKCLTNGSSFAELLFNCLSSADHGNNTPVPNLQHGSDEMTNAGLAPLINCPSTVQFDGVFISLGEKRSSDPPIVADTSTEVIGNGTFHLSGLAFGNRDFRSAAESSGTNSMLK